MPMFVHIAPATLEGRIRRSGLRPGEPIFEGAPLGIYAHPVLASHTLTHQWTREVLKWRRQPLVGVYFRTPDTQEVFFGHYNRGLFRLSAKEAYSAVRGAADPRGFEVIVPEAIPPKSIHRIAPLRGVMGWRHMPDAHQRRPCGCPACNPKGEPGSRKLRERYDRGEL